ncbi:MAG: diadenylate cyclase CdaA [Lachnospiraceae bacterium]|nr:diadenylate cyclase CdaA [Lachnospiraceae bacterium]
MQQIRAIISNYLSKIHIPKSMTISDVLEILIIAFLLYHLLVYIKRTRAWSLLKGLLAISVFILLAALLNMTTILWIVKNIASLAVLAMIIILQPELRRGLEELGQRNIFSSFFGLDLGGSAGRELSDQTINEIVRACTEMSKVKTGALIVIEQQTPLAEYERTGIDVDAVVTSQLLINIFEKNTPLHDGAVIIRGNRVTSATCYLPLSTSTKLNKDLGTRHRAAVGISEVSDALTVVVSEETGKISVAHKGSLNTDLDQAQLKNSLTLLQNKKEDEQEQMNILQRAILRRRGRGTEDV